MRLSPSTLASVALFSSSIMAAHADSFTLTSGPTTISFSLPGTLSPADSHNDLGHYFTELYVPVTANGQTTSSYWVEFNNAPNRGGLSIESAYGSLHQNGPVLFTGSLMQPTFLPGTYDLTNYSIYDKYQQDFTLVIASDQTPPTVTPEPSTFALLGTGLLGSIAAIRRRLNH